MLSSHTPCSFLLLGACTRHMPQPLLASQAHISLRVGPIFPCNMPSSARAYRPDHPCDKAQLARSVPSWHQPCPGTSHALAPAMPSWHQPCPAGTSHAQPCPASAQPAYATAATLHAQQTRPWPSKARACLQAITSFLHGTALGTFSIDHKCGLRLAYSMAMGTQAAASRARPNYSLCWGATASMLPHQPEASPLMRPDQACWGAGAAEGAQTGPALRAPAPCPCSNPWPPSAATRCLHIQTRARTQTNKLTCECTAG